MPLSYYCIQDNATMLTEASRGGHLNVANLLLREPRVQQPALHSSTRATKDYRHYERIKFASGRKSHSRNPHHHHQHSAHPAHTSHTAPGGKTLKPAIQPNDNVTTHHHHNNQVCHSRHSGRYSTTKCLLYGTSIYSVW